LILGEMEVLRAAVGRVDAHGRGVTCRLPTPSHGDDHD
jgi:uncharacterized protein YlxW (UPF0749 family)